MSLLALEAEVAYRHERAMATMLAVRAAQERRAQRRARRRAGRPARRWGWRGALVARAPGAPTAEGAALPR